MSGDNGDAGDDKTVTLPSGSGPAIDVELDLESTMKVDALTDPEVARSQRVLPRSTLPAPLGPFMLEKRLGIGGMAEVFFATKEGPGGFSKEIVVKRILPHLAEDPRFVEMFLREAQTAASLNHANVVQVYELGEADGQYFIAMEYVDGATLYKLARRAWHSGRSVPMEVVLRAIADGALGLNHAHGIRDAKTGEAVGLVHRDISPDNLMINRDGVTKVLDFGIAKGGNSAGVTKTGELKGKIPYMSPEQIRGEALDGRSDLYSLGITMYWLLTGQRPFSGATELMTLQGVLTEEASPPSSINSHVPPAVDDIVMALLEKDREYRPANGAELHDMLVSLTPGRTAASTSFVVDMIDTSDAKLPAATASPLSGDFVPSTPLTTKLGSAERRVMKRLPTPPRRKSKLPIAIAAGSSAALVFGALMLGLLIGGEEDGESDNLRPPPPALVKLKPPPEVKPVVEPTPAPPAPPPDSAASDAIGAAEPDDPEPVADAAATAATGKTKSTRRPKARKRPATASKAKPKVVPMTDVRVRAPRGVIWRASGKTVGSGTGTVSIPDGMGSLQAYDTKTGGTSRVGLSGGLADYNALGTGRLSLRIFPFASVSIGKKRLGTTPLSPVTLVQGSYTVKLTHEGKRVSRKITVKAGSVTKLKVDMRKE